MTNTPFDTNEQAQLKGLNGYEVDPIVTIGESINTYTPPGILDGLGAYELSDDTVRVLANHELTANVGYEYTLKNGTSLTGARVSYFDIDKETRQVVGSGLAYDTIINRQGEVVDEASDLEFNGLNRLCSAQYIGMHQFGNGVGLENGMFFTGEETGGGTEFVVDVATNTMYAVPWMGRAAWESVTELDTGDTEKVAILIGDDRGGAPLLMYVGTKDRSDDAGFLERNGLVNGKVYAWVADSGETSPEQFNGTFESRTGSWVEIDIYNTDPTQAAVDTDGDGNIQDELGYDADGFATQAQQDELARLAGAFTFSRPEDVATSPDDGTVAVMASTGRSSLFPSDVWGTTYKIDVDFNNIDSGDITAKLDILYDGDDAGAGQFAGGPDFGLRSPDNLEWADDGFIYLQEDRSTSNFGQTSGEEASIWRLDPESGELTRVGQVDRSAVPSGQTDPSPNDIGNWETSGIIDVSTLFDEQPGNLFIFDVQAHSLTDGAIADFDLVQGGQLAFLKNPLEGITEVSADETFDTSSPAQMEGLNGYNVDPVFTVGESFQTEEGVYTPPGILDGLGAFAYDDDTVRVLANHELRANLGYAYQLANGTFLTGARVSYFDINKETRELEDVGLAYDTIINRQGEVVDEASDLEFGGLNRLCSAQYIDMHQFGNGIGLEDAMFFTGEETGGGTEFVVDVATNTMYAVPWMGRAAWESVTELDTGNTENVAILIGDDRGGAPLLMYVGTKDRSAGAGFLERNGLVNGKVYAWKADSGETTPEQFNGTFENRTGTWVEIQIYDPTQAGTAVDSDGDGNIQDELGYDADGFATQAQQDELARLAGAFEFSRPEDVATNPEDGTVAVMASTGRSSLFPSDVWGTTYEINVNFNDIAAGDITADLDILYDGDDAGAGQFAGGPDFGLRSPDNLEWADDGFIYLQEDRSTSNFGQTSGEEASIWRLDPTTGELLRVSQVNRDAVPAGQTDSDPTDIGDWETSGIIDVSELFGEEAGELFLFDVQAHSLRDGVIEDANLVQGGQLAFLENPLETVNELSATNTFDTSSPAQMKGVDGSGYSVDPIFTVGESFNTGDEVYTPPGILDGLGAFAYDDDTVRVLANHELRANLGYAYQLANGTFLTGARVSYFDINKETRELEDVGLAYDTIINRQGEVVDEASDLEFGGLNRLCSAQYIDMHQFGNGIGLEDAMFFTGEETGGGTEFVVDVATNTMYAVPWMGRAAWESVTELDTGNTENVAILIGDDRGAAPLLMYVGTKDRSANASFLERNGLVNGKLYAWKADSGETTPEQFNGTFASRDGSWVEIDIYDPSQAGSAVDTDGDGNIQDELGYDADGFATQAQQDELARLAGAFEFSRPEDVATNPEDGTVAVMASTGRSSLFPSDVWGTTYKIDVDFNNIATGDITAKLDILYDGDDAGAGQFEGPDFGLRSPDNLEWADDGYIYLQEDRSTSEFGQTSGEEASIWRLNPISGELNRVSQVDRSAVPAGQTDSDPTDIGDWETSGIIDVSELFGEEAGELFLFDVQAHSLRDGVIEDANLVQGGQLAFLNVDTAIESPALEALNANPIRTTVTGDGKEVEIVDLTNFEDGSKVTVDYTISREADFNNEVYFYAVDDITGTVDGVAVGDEGYLQAALNNLVSSAFSTSDDNTESGSLEFTAGSYIAPLIIANNNLEAAQSGDATVYFSFPGASTDGFDHIQKLNDTTFGFEDLLNGGDQDFNDIVITIDQFTVTA